jgi:Right handed beta helix region
METRVSSASELQATLASASGGDTILLESGNYGRINLENLKFNDHVTIKSADGDGGARFQHITIKGSTHLNLDSLTVEFGQPDRHNDKAIDIQNSDHVKVVNSEIIGHAGTKDWSDVGRGVEVWQGSSNIEFSDNHFHHLARAALFLGVSDIIFNNNHIDDIRYDGIFVGNSRNVLIEDNFLTDFYRQGTDHADYIQFDPGTSGASRDVIIRSNVMLKGNGNGDVQGIFGANHYADVHGSVFTNFLVENNIYFDTGLNAIQFYSGDTMTVRNNTVLSDPADGRVVWVRLHGPQTNSIIEDNVATQVDAEGGATASGNIIAQFRNPSNANYYGDLFADPFADPATLEDLAPKPGAIGYGSGKGAEERFQELLNGAPDSSGPGDSETPGAVDAAASADDEHDAADSFGQDGLKLHLNGKLENSNGDKGDLTDNGEPIAPGAGEGLDGDGVAGDLGDVFDDSATDVVFHEEPADSDGLLLS